MENQQELRPTSTAIEPRSCPCCSTAMTCFNELGVYWWYHCPNCLHEEDEAIELSPEDYEPLPLTEEQSGLDLD